jgi:hypothetical protein
MFSQQIFLQLNFLMNADAIEEFTVEMQVQWWEAIKGTGAGAGGEDIN